MDSFLEDSPSGALEDERAAAFTHSVSLSFGGEVPEEEESSTGLFFLMEDSEMGVC